MKNKGFLASRSSQGAGSALSQDEIEDIVGRAYGTLPKTLSGLGGYLPHYIPRDVESDLRSAGRLAALEALRGWDGAGDLQAYVFRKVSESLVEEVRRGNASVQSPAVGGYDKKHRKSHSRVGYESRDVRELHAASGPSLSEKARLEIARESLSPAAAKVLEQCERYGSAERMATQLRQSEPAIRDKLAAAQRELCDVLKQLDQDSATAARKVGAYIRDFKSGPSDDVRMLDRGYLENERKKAAAEGRTLTQKQERKLLAAEANRRRASTLRAPTAEFRAAVARWLNADSLFLCSVRPGAVLYRHASMRSRSKRSDSLHEFKEKCLALWNRDEAGKFTKAWAHYEFHDLDAALDKPRGTLSYVEFFREKKRIIEESGFDYERQRLELKKLRASNLPLLKFIQEHGAEYKALTAMDANQWGPFDPGSMAA